MLSFSQIIFAIFKNNFFFIIGALYSYLFVYFAPCMYQYFLTGKAEVKPFDPDVAMNAPYPMDGFQTLYFVAKSFLDALQKFR